MQQNPWFAALDVDEQLTSTMPTFACCQVTAGSSQPRIVIGKDRTCKVDQSCGLHVGYQRWVLWQGSFRIMPCCLAFSRRCTTFGRVCFMFPSTLWVLGHAESGPVQVQVS